MSGRSALSTGSEHLAKWPLPRTSKGGLPWHPRGATSLWEVQRLFLLAAKMESPATCPMARIPADELAVLCGMISEYLCVPPDMHLHPPAYLYCKICFTSICDVCEENAMDCQCGSNNLRSRP